MSLIRGVLLAVLGSVAASVALAQGPPPRPREPGAAPPQAGAAPPQAGAAPPQAGVAPVDLAYGAYQRGLYLTAFREATARLDRDPKDGPAMTLLGELFNQGLGVRQNAEEAAGWYRLAAQQNDPGALATLGLMAIDGRGMARDPGKARTWLERAAALGEPTACYNLARLLISGGREEDLPSAVQFLRRAAEAEIGDAQHALGVLYARGRGVLKNPEEAARLYLRAARNGSIAGRVEYAIARYNGFGTGRDETEAARHFLHAAFTGNAIAQNRVARIYASGRGLPKNLVEAAAWNLAAGHQGLNDAWLDDAVRGLNPTEKAKAEALAAVRSGRL